MWFVWKCKVFVNALLLILTQRAYIGNGEKSCFILQQIHWAETRDVIKRRSEAILIFGDVNFHFHDVRRCNVVFSH